MNRNILGQCFAIITFSSIFSSGCSKADVSVSSLKKRIQSAVPPGTSRKKAEAELGRLKFEFNYNPKLNVTTGIAKDIDRSLLTTKTLQVQIFYNKSGEVASIKFEEKYTGP